MTILSLAGVTANSPFCDALDVTFPADWRDGVDAALRPFLVDAGGEVAFEGTWRVPRPMKDFETADQALVQRVPTVACSAFGPVYRVSFSGGSVDRFRYDGHWASLLANLFEFPHRVTRIDATVDARVDAPPLVRFLADRARSEPVKLGRKSVEPGHVQTWLELDARGDLTGTLYLGRPRREIRAKVYDKRHQLETLGARDPGPWLRAELTLRAVGATFRDAVDPSAIFWNYASGFVAPPPDAPQWSTGDTGFALPPKAERDSWKLLQRRVEDWTTLQEIAALSDSLGPYGRRMLLGLIARAIGVVLPADLYSAGSTAPVAGVH